MKKTHENGRSLRTVYRILSAAVCLAVIAVLVTVVSWMPRFGDDHNPADNEVYERYVEEGTEEAGAINTVADMILDYRAFDTLGESNVLFAAAFHSLIRIFARKRKVWEKENWQSSLIWSGMRTYFNIRSL